jgi:hypothetical protein
MKRSSAGSVRQRNAAIENQQKAIVARAAERRIEI